jgi:hypothetical protein
MYTFIERKLGPRLTLSWSVTPNDNSIPVTTDVLRAHLAKTDKDELTLREERARTILGTLAVLYVILYHGQAVPSVVIGLQCKEGRHRENDFKTI